MTSRPHGPVNSLDGHNGVGCGGKAVLGDLKVLSIQLASLAGKTRREARSEV